ncbi:MAG: hypothetical protein ACK41T_10410 [Pseudobdellovibrio sp.]
MKTIKNQIAKSIIAMTMILTSFAAVAADKPYEKEVQVGINGVFVPGGFDSSSDAYVVVNGIFQNGCYKWSRAEVSNTDEYNHEIKSIASVTQGMCIMVLVPFQKDVRLGKLSSGKHNLKFLNGDGTYLERSLVVE